MPKKEVTEELLKEMASEFYIRVELPCFFCHSEIGIEDIPCAFYPAFSGMSERYPTLDQKALEIAKNALEKHGWSYLDLNSEVSEITGEQTEGFACPDCTKKFESDKLVKELIDEG